MKLVVDANKLVPEKPEDVPYFALALKLGCAVWSNESFAQSKVTVFTTDDILRLLKKPK